jgi:hypothetical protein
MGQYVVDMGFGMDVEVGSGIVRVTIGRGRGSPALHDPVIVGDWEGAGMAETMDRVARLRCAARDKTDSETAVKGEIGSWGTVEAAWAGSRTSGELAGIVKMLLRPPV